MEYVQGFKEIMEVSAHLALATSMDNKPNVRVMSHFYDQQKGIVYVSTIKQSPKTAEFASNDKVAFTTLPEPAGRLVRVTDAIVKKSGHTVYDLKTGFTKNNPAFESTLEKMGPMFDVYEFHFNEAIVTLGPMRMEKITL
ncbi:pyridoxamine 5'-phosphate oxidase family protein [Paenibacillus sp. LMG 31459]|uniref:Pyridoxamine 5'-phosphate oxidase family protein n=1 Tax=Paenibacillus phytohabitans TaxID=2654978 RepID=A0ABX1YHD9_9BACL|nr:pyridoxamine 5'-phosphate oxidase family protein [Paenibacillus phytohabitans]NOU80442.1 pyridoxamine 5'-phosphate oxidase family protein [Paenibacillus phytohabitans]